MMRYKCFDGSESVSDTLHESLKQQIVNAIESCTLPREKIIVEVEGRLGTLWDPKTRCRIELPVISEALLPPSGEQLDYTFAATLTKKQFIVAEAAIAARMKELTSPSKPEAQSFKRRRRDTCQPTTSTTTDKIYSLPEDVRTLIGLPTAVDTVRLSYETGQAQPREIISKQHLAVFNVHSGRAKLIMEDENEEAPCQRLDMRLSVNLEYKLPIVVVTKVGMPKLIRHRKRSTYRVGDALRFDITSVETVKTTQRDSSPETSHEVEVELEPARLRFEYDSMLNDKDNCFDVLIKDLVGTVRDLMIHVNNYRPEPPVERKRNTDLTGCAQSKTSLDLYLSHVSPVVPIIGDYLYRAVAPPLSTTDVIGEDDIEDSKRITLTEAEESELTIVEQNAAHLRKILYPHKNIISEMMRNFPQRRFEQRS